MINVFDAEEMKARHLKELKKKQNEEIMIKNLNDARIKNKPQPKKRSVSALITDDSHFGLNEDLITE